MNTRIYLLVFFAFFLSELKAQQHIGNTQFLWNQMAINPAYAGSGDALQTGLFYRNQWAGLEGAPTTENIFVHAPVSKQGFGAGLNLMRDRIGIARDLSAEASFSYKMRFNAGSLSLGLSAMYGSQRMDWLSTDPYTMGDQAIPFADIAEHTFNFGFGAFFRSERFFAGFSIPRLLEQEARFMSPESGVQAIVQGRRHLYATLGGIVPLSASLDLQPIAMLRYVEGAPFQSDFGALLHFNDLLWVGATMRWGDSVSLLVDYDINRQLRVGYAFDYTLSRLQGHAGSHEFFLGFALLKKRDGYNHPRFF